MKVRVQIDDNPGENWEIDQEQSNPPELIISKGDKSIEVTFEPGHYEAYQKGFKECPGLDQYGNTIFLTSLSK